MLLRHCCRFSNNVAGFGNNVERNFVLSTKSKPTEHVQFVSTLWKGRNFAINSFDIIAVLTKKSNVASTLLLVWTGLYKTYLVYKRNEACYLLLLK